ncbi:Hpt domain-containing protein [Nisaea nitritireducens]|uniref:Hpt domain-containing protein n=1 Tax=Nisaea nitritireducens TaxID=568392 RepID=UPI001867D296|nr:Hpt domain-containing protein [Nisaea nitritireducens]
MTDGDLRQAFLALRDEFLEICRGRIGVIERNWSEITSGSDDAKNPEALEFVKREAHTIAGTSGTYGYADVSKSAKELEVLCIRLMDQGVSDMDDAQKEELAAAVTSLLEESTRMFADPEIGTVPF